MINYLKYYCELIKHHWMEIMHFYWTRFYMTIFVIMFVDGRAASFCVVASTPATIGLTMHLHPRWGSSLAIIILRFSVLFHPSVLPARCCNPLELIRPFILNGIPNARAISQPFWGWRRHVSRNDGLDTGFVNYSGAVGVVI